ncbi:hypothetical protein A0H81_08068 [Grifola frondosa]|uniref:Tf2-1-like SH3-like domain-containing protein n=1 Tax=Grifola frondosa TaxID=5627 RepID=A0A1C7M6D2_GRIFR|nr:hypothetical protein A0H81_08068 [Grifola frondosa]
MVWEDASKNEYPGVRAYAQRVKNAVMAAHDSILAARVKQTRGANRRRRPAPFVEGDLVYISTKNISLPKGLARKLAPKFIGPYKIVRDFSNNSYRLDLPSNLRRRGIHDIFHSSLLRVHEPNDDRLFPGRLDSQVAELEDRDGEWAIDKIVSHRGARESAVFEAVWKSGDRTWVPYASVEHLDALKAYLEANGVDQISALGEGNGNVPNDPQVFLGGLEFRSDVETARRKSLKERVGRRTPTRRVFAPDTLPQNTSPILHLPNPPPTTLLDPRDLEPSLLGFPFFNPDCFILSLMANNVNLARNRNQDIILTDNVLHDRHLFLVPQVRLYVEFDRLLRSRPYSRDRDVIPGGYDTFMALWNSDPHCPYKFCQVVVTTGETRVFGEPVVESYLLPPREEERAPEFTPAQRRAVDNLLWQNAMQVGRRQDFYAKRQAEKAEAAAVAKRPRLMGEEDEQEERDERTAGKPKKKKAGGHSKAKGKGPLTERLHRRRTIRRMAALDRRGLAVRRVARRAQLARRARRVPKVRWALLPTNTVCCRWRNRRV